MTYNIDQHVLCYSQENETLHLRVEGREIVGKVTLNCDGEQGDKASSFPVKQANKRAAIYRTLSWGATTVKSAQKQNRF